MVDGHLWIFTARSSAVAYLRALVSLGHSTVDVDRELVAIQIELLVVSITSISIKFTESRFKKDIRSYANGKQKI